MSATTSANAVESKGKYDGGGSYLKVTTVTKQAFQVECFSKIATQIKNIYPIVNKEVLAPGVITANPAVFSPPTSDVSAFMQIRGSKQTGAIGTVPATMVNTGKYVPLYKFVLYFKTPVANPRLNLAGTEGVIADAAGLPKTTSGLAIEFSGAKMDPGEKAVAISTQRVSGIDAAPGSAYRIESNKVLTDTVACVGYDSCTNPDAQLAAVKSKLPSVTSLTTPLRGTVELNSGGVRLKKVTVTVSARFFSSTSGAVSAVVPGFAISPQLRSEISAFPRTLGKYGHAMHAMPMVGNDNLRLGNTIVEGNRERYTNELNSGTAADNSDAGYDGLGTFYWEGDKSKTPVTTVTSAHKNKWLMLDVPVKSGRTDKTAYVYGYLDWTGIGDFAKVDKGKSTKGAVSKGNGTATIKWKVPSKVTTDPINLRLRVAYDCCEIDKPTGPALSGEVEDWAGVINRKPNNLKVVKEVTSGQSVAPGGQVTYTITLKNLNGKASESPVTITDALPNVLGGLVISQPPSAGNATISGNNLTWSFPAGITSDASVKITGTVAPATAPGEVPNTAKLDALCDPGNCESTATFSVKSLAGDLQLTKRVVQLSQNPARAGTRVTYEATMSYTGDLPLDAFSFTDAMIPDAAWNCTATFPASLPSGYTNTCTAQYVVSAQDVRDNWATGELVNTARVAGTMATTPPVTLSREASATVELDTSTDRVEITGSKSVSPTSVVPGQSATYTITARNDGALPATDVVITDTFDGRAPVTVDPADCVWPGVVGTLSPGDEVVCTVQYTATAADARSTLTNTASATAKDGTEDYGPVDLGTAELVVNDASMSIVKSNSLDPNDPTVQVGDAFTYTIVVTNTGSVRQSDVQVIDVLPDGLELDPPNQAGWSVDPIDPRVVISDEFTLDPGDSITLSMEVVVTSNASGLLVNVVALSNLNSGRACVGNPKLTGCAVDEHPPAVFSNPLVLSKTSDVEEGEGVWIGRVVTYTLKLENTTDQDATDVVLTDRLPTHLEAYPTSQPGWTISGLRLTSDPFDLPAHTTKTLTLTARARVATDQPVRNWVVVSGYTLEDGSGNRQAAATGPYVAPQMTVEQCELSGDKARCAHADIPAIEPRKGLSAQLITTAPAQVKAGDTFEYMVLLVNSTKEDATKVPVTHALPSGLVFDGTQDSYWTVDGNKASAEITVPARTAAAYWLTVKVADGATGPLQAFTLIDGASLVDCQANLSSPGCIADARPPIAR